MAWRLILSTCLFQVHSELISTNFLFNGDKHVHELKKPFDLVEFTGGIPLTTNESSICGSGSRLFLLYSGHCPHCHAFQPTWSRFAEDVQCDKNMQVGAFECVGKDEDRYSKVQPRKSHFPVDEDNDTMISPKEVCGPLKNEYYPTLVLAVRKSCQVKLPFMKIKEPQPFRGIELYHIPCDSETTTVASLVESLAREKILSQCVRLQSATDQDKEIERWLGSNNSSSYDRRARWPDAATQLEPDLRVHDAAVGLLHILDDWILSEGVTLREPELRNLQNFMRVAIATAADSKLRRDLLKVLHKLEDHGVRLSALEWQKEVANLTVYGISGKSVKEDPLSVALTCHTLSCLAWTYFHTSAQTRLLQQVKDNASGKSSATVTFVELLPSDDLRKFKIDGKIESLRVTSTDFAKALRGLVDSFFDCKDCRKHFLSAFDQCLADRCVWTKSGVPQLTDALQLKGELAASVGLVMYLWRFHNLVTVRTATESSLSRLRIDFDRDPSGNHTRLPYWDSDVRIPTIEMCKNCRRANSTSHRITTDLILGLMHLGDSPDLHYDEIGDFRLEAILEFLKTYYIPESLQKVGDWKEIEELQWNSTTKRYHVVEQRKLKGVEDSVKKVENDEKETPMDGTAFAFNYLRGHLANAIHVVVRDKEGMNKSIVAKVELRNAETQWLARLSLLLGMSFTLKISVLPLVTTTR